MKKKILGLLLILALGIFAGDYIYRYMLNVEGCPKCRQQGNRKYYGQYLEDYILSLVFAGQENGFYVDVGAADPASGSVTKYFYNLSWHGINIEPIKAHYNDLVKERPRDKNYNIGIADKNTSLEFYQAASTGLSGFAAGASDYESKYIVPVRTLSEILAENKVTEIDFLKIDVEGFERNVLLGMDFKQYRPKVILLEALDPKYLEPSHQPWEEFLLEADYKFILFDGLNRFYVDANQPQLIDNFKEAYRCIMQINQAKHILLKEPYLPKL